VRKRIFRLKRDEVTEGLTKLYNVFHYLFCSSNTRLVDDKISGVERGDAYTTACMSKIECIENLRNLKRRDHYVQMGIGN
jgi:hypothetical protein